MKGASSTQARKNLGLFDEAASHFPKIRFRPNSGDTSELREASDGKMDGLRRFNHLLVKVGSWGTMLFISIIAVVVPYEVAGRYLFGKMTVWSGEVAIYSLAWASMLGGAVGLRKGYQVAVTSLVEAVPKELSWLLRCVGYSFSLFFYGVMIAWGLYQTVYNFKQTSPAIGLVMSIPYASIPFGFFIMLSVTLEEFLALLMEVKRAEGQ